jgi:pantetheine-phosphate adenylyltransferase
MCQNFDKVTLFSPEARFELVKLTAESFPNVRAERHEGWLYEYLRKTENAVLFKGVRDSRDLEYEKNMAEFNFEHSGVETIFIFADKNTAEVSSTLVRTAMKEGKDWLRFIPQIAQKKAAYEQNATKDSPPFKSVRYKIDYETDTFYIPKEASYAADVRYDKKGSGIGTILIAVVIALLLAVFVIFILPDMMRLLDNFVGMMRPEANYH